MPPMTKRAMGVPTDADKGERRAQPLSEPTEKVEASPETGYPKTFYNPIVIDERFYMPGSAYPVHFASGRYVAVDSATEEGVRSALAIYGKDKPERWHGDDMKREWVCRQCGFRTRNTDAQDDHQLLKQH